MKQIMRVYWALAAGQIIIGGISYLLISLNVLGTADYNLALTFQKVALLLVPSAMAAGYFIFRYQLTKIDPKLSLEEKLKKYLSLVVIRSALFEVAFMFCIVSALATRVTLFLVMAPIVFLVFLLVRPSQPAVIGDLQLSQNDSIKLNSL